MFLPRDDPRAAKRLPSYSCRNPGGGCSSAPLTHPSHWASHGPGTWRRGTSGAGGCRSFCEKLNHMILKNFRHLRKLQFQNHQDPQQLQGTIIRTNISVYSGSQGLNLFIKMGHNNEGRHFKAGETVWLKVKALALELASLDSNPFSVSCVTLGKLHNSSKSQPVEVKL